MLRLSLAALLLSASTAFAASDHLVRTVQHGLNVWGFHEVDVRTLDDDTIGRLYLALNDAPPRFSRKALQFPNRLRVILGEY